MLCLHVVILVPSAYHIVNGGSFFTAVNLYATKRHRPDPSLRLFDRATEMSAIARWKVRSTLTISTVELLLVLLVSPSLQIAEQWRSPCMQPDPSRFNIRRSFQLKDHDGISCLDKSGKYQLLTIARLKRQGTFPIDPSQHTSNLNAVSSSLLPLSNSSAFQISQINIGSIAPRNRACQLL